MQPQQTSRRFILSLILILVSFVLLVGIAFNSLRFQQEMLSRQNRAEKLRRIDQISEEYFRQLETSPLPAEAIPLPMSKPSLPALSAPDSALARNIFMKIAMGAGSKQALLIEAELNSSPDEQDFWRYLQMNEYAATGNHFEMRRCAFQILNSNFDFLLDNGRTLKTEAALQVAQAFLAENNPESCRQWLLRLRTLPVPIAIPQSPKQMLKGEPPPQLLAWLDFLIHCYQLSYAEPIESGWKQNQNSETLVIKHANGIAAFSSSTVLAGLTSLLRQRAFSEVVVTRSPGLQGNSHLLAGSAGLWATIDATEPPAPFPGGFVLLLILTSAGILGLFWFSLHEWEFIQKARLLEEEENFFRQTAHDLKTPITNVSFLAETLALKRYRSEEQQNRYLSQLQIETSKAAELFDRLLLSVRLRRKTVTAELKSISAVDMLKSLLTRFRTRLHDWKTFEEFEYDGLVLADPDMFERVMINLIENVLRHASEGKTLILRTCILPGMKDGEAAVMIGDAGEAFPVSLVAGDLDLLNNGLIYRPERGGSGTGLFLVRQIMTTHAGHFFARHRPEKGVWMVTTWKTVKS